jgi:hypothetical protein
VKGAKIVHPAVIARINAEAPARLAHAALVRALEAVMKLEPQARAVAIEAAAKIRLHGKHAAAFVGIGANALDYRPRARQGALDHPQRRP